MLSEISETAERPGPCRRGHFSIRVSRVMGCVTILSDADSVERRIPCLGRDRATAFRAVILALGILLTAAAIAACVTVVTEWAHAAYFPANTKLKAEFRSELARDSEGDHAAVATTAPAAAAFLFASPFARGSGLLFLPEPVGSQALRQDQASGRTSAERPSAGLVVGALLPVRAPSDELEIKAPLPRSRPFNNKDLQAKNDTAEFSGRCYHSKKLSGRYSDRSIHILHFFGEALSLLASPQRHKASAGSRCSYCGL